jgi:hypothetical protein
MEQQTLEGTWEEILQYAPQLAGQRVKLTVLSVKSIMTLTELLPTLQELSVFEKIKLIRLLAEDLELQKDIAPLEPFKTYNLLTPYNTFGAGALLMQAMDSKTQA